MHSGPALTDRVETGRLVVSVKGHLEVSAHSFQHWGATLVLWGHLFSDVVIWVFASSWSLHLPRQAWLAAHGNVLWKCLPVCSSRFSYVFPRCSAPTTHAAAFASTSVLCAAAPFLHRCRYWSSWAAPLCPSVGRCRYRCRTGRQLWMATAPLTALGDSTTAASMIYASSARARTALWGGVGVVGGSARGGARRASNWIADACNELRRLQHTQRTAERSPATTDAHTHDVCTHTITIACVSKSATCDKMYRMASGRRWRGGRRSRRPPQHDRCPPAPQQYPLSYRRQPPK